MSTFILVHFPPQLMSEKDADWAARHEHLQKDLRNALRTNYEQTNVEHMTRQQLEQVRIKDANENI